MRSDDPPKMPRQAPKVDVERLEALGREVLIALGENPEDARVRGTPGRWARMWRDFLNAPVPTLTSFDYEARGGSAGFVTVSGMRVWSFCEHHLIPFWCDVAVAYVPHQQVLGLSKFARIAHAAAGRLQLQERLVRDIADGIEAATGCQHVAVLARGEHLCMTMRGVKTPAIMTSTAFRGIFVENPCRAEFLDLATRV